MLTALRTPLLTDFLYNILRLQQLHISKYYATVGYMLQ